MYKYALHCAENYVRMDDPKKEWLKDHGAKLLHTNTGMDVGFLVYDDVLWIFVQGTNNWDDVLTDIMVWLTKYKINSNTMIPYDGVSSEIRVSRGFHTRGILSFRSTVHMEIRKAQRLHGIDVVRVVGHSMGGAVAEDIALDVQYNFADYYLPDFPTLRTVQCVTFGGVALGNLAFYKSFYRRMGGENGYLRVTSPIDPAVRYPISQAIARATCQPKASELSVFCGHGIQSYISALRTAQRKKDAKTTCNIAKSSIDYDI
jgi:hypothetical protein